MKLYIASFNRASNGAINHLYQALLKKKMIATTPEEATHILAVGDRTETFDFVLNQYRKNKPIIHLWSGETTSFSTHDDVYRHAMTLMSDLQLCTNKKAKNTTINLCWVANKEPNAHVVGNVMLDDLSVDESQVPHHKFDLILYNPPSRLSHEEIQKEIKQIHKHIHHKFMWLEPNGDRGSALLARHITNTTFPRSQFLGLLKNCEQFITNSSCQFYEAPFLMDKEKIVSIGHRNAERNSKTF